MVKDLPRRATALADEAELAYKEAVDRIEFAKTFGFQSLELDGLKFLERLPDEIVELEDLKRLSIDGTFIHDLRLVANLKQLQRLSLNKTRVSDLSPLSGLVELESVSADRTDVSDLRPLAKLGKLKRLSLRRTKVRDVHALRGLESVEFLDLYWTPVRDISGLSSLRSLTHLSLERTKVEDLSAISKLTQLRSLQLYWTRVADLSPLSNHSELRRLSIGRTRVKDLAPIARMTGLADAAVASTFFWHFDLYDTPALDIQRQNERKNGHLIVSLPEPHRTVGLINKQRVAQRLEPYFPPGYKSLEVPAEDALPEDPTITESLKQTAASYSFSFSNGLIEAWAQVETPGHPELAADIHREVLGKCVEVQARFRNAPDRLRSSLDRLIAALGDDVSDVRPGVLLMRSRSLEADVLAYDTEEGRLELFPDALSLLKDLSASVEDLKGCFPQLAEIEAARLAQGLLEAGVDEAVHSMAGIREAASTSAVVAPSAVAALKIGEPDVQHATEIITGVGDLSVRAAAIKKRAVIVGQMLLDYRNFGASVLREATSTLRRTPGIATLAKAGADLKKVGAESWQEAVKAVPPAVGKGVSKGVEQATSAAIKTGAAALAYSIGGWLGALGVLAGSFIPLAQKADEIKSEIDQSIERESPESDQEPDAASAE